jgi:hypothetical protein
MNRYHNLNIYGHIALELGADNDLSGSTVNSHNVPTADISFLRFTGTNPTVSGFADGSSNNKILIVSFVPDVGAETGGVLTLKYESTYSSSGNRIKTNDGNDLVLNPYESAFLLYDSYDTVWRVVSSPSAAAGGNTFGSINITGSGVVFEGATANEFETTLTVEDPTADRTITLPNATTTLVGTDVSQALTNKTINGNDNTITNIGNAALTNSNISINGTSVSLGSSITVRSFTSANITTNTTVVSWTQNFVFTSNGAITVTLPASPSNGDRVRVIDADYGSAGTNITVARNGNKINNVADDIYIDINGAAVEFVYNTTAGNWQIVNNPI